MRAHVLGVLLVSSVVPATVLTTLTPPAFAQSDDDRATARALGQEGEAALDRKDWKIAEDRFSRAEKLFHAPTLELGLARAQVGNGHLLAAQETYNRLIHEGLPPGAPAIFVHALEAARQEVEAVTPRLGKAVVTVAAPGGGDVGNPHVTIDDKPFNNAALGATRFMDPGTHTVKVTADGFNPGETRFTVVEGGSSNVTVSMVRGAPGAAVASAKPDANVTAPEGQEHPATNANGSAGATGGAGSAGIATTPSSGAGSLQKTLGFASLGVAAATGIGTIVTGVMAINKHSYIKNQIYKYCNGSTYVCSEYTGYSSDDSSLHTIGGVATALGVATGVFVAAGLTLYFTAPKSTEHAPTASVTPYLAPGAVGVFGTF